jgi:hypothetical protein
MCNNCGQSPDNSWKALLEMNELPSNTQTKTTMKKQQAATDSRLNSGFKPFRLHPYKGGFRGCNQRSLWDEARIIGKALSSAKADCPMDWINASTSCEL